MVSVTICGSLEELEARLMLTLAFRQKDLNINVLESHLFSCHSGIIPVHPDNMTGFPQDHSRLNTCVPEGVRKRWRKGAGADEPYALVSLAARAAYWSSSLGRCAECEHLRKARERGGLRVQRRVQVSECWVRLKG